MSDKKRRLPLDVARQFLGSRQGLFNSIQDSFAEAFNAAKNTEQKDYFTMIICAMELARNAMEGNEQRELIELLGINESTYSVPPEILRAAMHEVGMDPDKSMQVPTTEQREALTERLRKWKVEKES